MTSMGYEIPERQIEESLEIQEFTNSMRNNYNVSQDVAELLYVANLDESELVIALALLPHHDIRYAIRHAHRVIMTEDLNKTIAKHYRIK